ncbi:hypothetical protein BH20ACT8_BH20ACT8_11650 [soil metagenome]
MSEETSANQPTEEELQAYLGQLREADVAQVVVQAYQVLGTGAEVKLGRADARLLIDAMDAFVVTLDGRAPGELVEQMRAGVRQLQTAQVEAERDGAQEQGAGRPGGEQDDRGAPPSTGPPSAPQAQPPTPSPASEPPQTKRLWVPGQ